MELTDHIAFRGAAEKEKALTQSKKCLANAPVLRYFDLRCPIVIATDASRFVLGAGMEQDFSDGRYPMAYLSRTLNAVEQNYTPHNSEKLGIVRAITSWHCYLHG